MSARCRNKGAPRLRVGDAPSRTRTRSRLIRLPLSHLWIRLNLELARRPQRCIEYQLVHELVHQLEANHGPKFIALMDRHLPSWRLRAQLNEGPLAHQEWSY